MPKASSNRRPSGPRSAPYPSPKPQATDTPALTEKSTSSLNAAATNKSSSPSEPRAQSFLDIELEGEGDHSVPVYDTCLVIRNKLSKLINADNHKPESEIPGEHLKNGKPKYWTIKAFVDALGDGVSEKQYRGFVKKSGNMGGAEMEVYYKAYCFFEKKRIWEGKPKSAARKHAEEEHPDGLKLFDTTKKHWMLGVYRQPGSGKPYMGNKLVKVKESDL